MGFTRALYLLVHVPRKDRARLVADVTYHVEGDAYVFSEGKGLGDEHITLDLVDVDLRRALKLACAQIDANYALDLGEYATRRVTLSLHDVRFGEAIVSILQTVKLSPRELWYGVFHDMVIVGFLREWYSTEPPPNRDYTLVGGTYNTPRVDYLHDKIDLHVAQEDLHIALGAVCLVGGGNFSLTPMSGLASVTKNLNLTPFDQTIKILMRHSKVSLTFKVDQGIVEIVERYGAKMMR